MTQSVTNIRAATRYDAAALARLGARSDRVRARALLAEEAGEIIAAIDLTSGKVFADSARSTSEVVHALRQRRRATHHIAVCAGAARLLAGCRGLAKHRPRHRRLKWSLAAGRQGETNVPTPAAQTAPPPGAAPLGVSAGGDL